MRRIAMFAGIVSTLAAAAALTVAAPPAATAGPAPRVGTPTDVVTLKWIDAGTGTVTRTWTGPAVAATAIRRAVVPPPDTVAGTGTDTDAGSDAGVAGGAQLGPVLPLTRRLSCSDPNPYWDVRNYPPLLCFADAGDINVAIYSVYEVDSGNNSGSVTWWYNSRGFVQPLGRWTSVFFSARVFVSHIHIN